jgi:hypothetical protein
MIHTVYLIHQLSGVCVIYKKYGTISFNEDLIAGFLTALKDFSQEVTGGQGTIKVLDMVVYNIHLVFQSGLLIAAASDKKDDKLLVTNAIEGILQKFFVGYANVVDNWNGDIRAFKDFEPIMDDVLKGGLVAEVPREYPVLALFEKDYKNELKVLKKGIDVKTDKKDVVKQQNIKWKEKKMPQVVISQGYLTKEEYDIAHLCDGFHDYEEIAQMSNKSEEDIKKVVKKLEKLDMVKIVKV